MRKGVVYALCTAASVVLLWLSLAHKIESDWTEVVATVSGAWCVWLVVKEHIWNWPIGLVNAALSTIVFWRAGFRDDAGLQVVYFVLGILGWYWWLFGGQSQTPLRVELSSKTVLWVSTLAGIAGTYVLWRVALYFKGASPLIDALTSSFSLVAQYWVTRKLLENWLLWIAVNLVYVPLYAIRGLYLMAALYTVYLILAVVGYVDWRNVYRAQAAI